MKVLENLKGAKKLSKKEQITINGGRAPKPELCPGTDPIVVCYYPEQCTEGPNGEWYCS